MFKRSWLSVDAIDLDSVYSAVAQSVSHYSIRLSVYIVTIHYFIIGKLTDDIHYFSELQSLFNVLLCNESVLFLRI